MARSTRSCTVPSPTPASNMRSAGGRGWTLASSSPTRLATTHFSLQVLTNSRYFCRLSKKRKLRCGSRSPAGVGPNEAGNSGGPRGRLDDRRTRGVGGRPVGFHEAPDAVERLGRDPTAVAQPRGQLAVIDGTPAEGRFREPAVPTIVGDFLQQFLGVHARRLG